MICDQMNVSGLVKHYRSELLSIYPAPEVDGIIAIAFEETAGYRKIDTFLKGEEMLSAAQTKKLLTIVEELKTGKPIQYIIGNTNFYGLQINVNNHVLIPRPETEELVDWIIKDHSKASGATVIDLCTGSGCIALALKKSLSFSQVFGADNSIGALNVAKENALKNKLMVDFFHFDLLKQESLGFMKFDLMVSNPPYVLESERAFMQPNVLDHEPHEALFVTDEEPLVFYRKIVDLADGHLDRRGCLYFEINEAYGSELSQLLKDRGYMGVELRKDLNGKDRMLRGVKP